MLRKQYPKWNAYVWSSKYRFILKCTRNEMSCEQNCFNAGLKSHTSLSAFRLSCERTLSPFSILERNICLSFKDEKIMIDFYEYVLNCAYCFSLKIFPLECVLFLILLGKYRRLCLVTWMCSVVKVFLEISQNSQGDSCARAFFTEHLRWLFLKVIV